jgi:hypothetical protein
MCSETPRLLRRICLKDRVAFLTRSTLRALEEFAPIS